MENQKSIATIITDFFKDTFNIKKRITVREFIIPVIIYYILLIVIGFIAGIILYTIIVRQSVTTFVGVDGSFSITSDNVDLFFPLWQQILADIVVILASLPLITAKIRRLNDIGLLPKISLIIMIVLTAIPFVLSGIISSLVLFIVQLIAFLLPTNYLINKKSGSIPASWLRDEN